jgi:hypothetical protein
VDDEVVRAERHAALDLLAEGAHGLLADDGVGRREVDQVVRVDDDGRDARLKPHALEGLDLFVNQRARAPPARVARENLHRVAAERVRLQQRVLQPARNRRVKPDARASSRPARLRRLSL